MKWGILGGTFDPIHLGHLRCAEEVREAFGLEKIFFVPAASPPLKQTKITSFPDRLAMVKLAIEGNSAFEVSGVEGRRKGLSYSIDTVRSFREAQGKSLELFFILGQDAFSDIRKWKGWEELLFLCNFVVMARPGYENQRLDDILSPAVAARYRYTNRRKAFRCEGRTFIFFRSVTFLDISSTDIRKRILKKKSVRYLLSDPVRKYIDQQSLYRSHL